MSSFWAHLNVKLENCQTLRALIKRWNIQIIHLAVKAAQNHHWQLHLLLAPRLRASGSPQRRGMFPVQHAQRENAFSKHRSRTLMPTCLLQLQFLCAQHHLECGHWQTRTWPVIKTPLQGDCAFFNKRTIPKAQRCGSSLGYSRLATRHNSSAKTHLRQQPGADPHTSRAIRNKFTHTEGRSSFAPGLCEIRAQATFSSSFKVRVTAGRCNGEHRGPVRWGAVCPARPSPVKIGSVRLGSAPWPSTLSADDCVHFCSLLL